MHRMARICMAMGIGAAYGDPARAQAELGWSAKPGTETTAEDPLRWQLQKVHPNGFGGLDQDVGVESGAAA